MYPSGTMGVMPRRRLPTTRGRVRVPAHLLLQGEDAGTALDSRLRRYAKWKLSPFLLTRPEVLARLLARKGRTAAEILRALADFDGRAEAEGLRLTPQERGQVNYIGWAIENDPANARRVLRRWLAKGRLAPKASRTRGPVWVVHVRCGTCNREEAILDRLALPHTTGTGFCLTCRRRRDFRVLRRYRVPDGRRGGLIKAWNQTSQAQRSRVLLDWLH